MTSPVGSDRGIRSFPSGGLLVSFGWIRLADVGHAIYEEDMIDHQTADDSDVGGAHVVEIFLEQGRAVCDGRITRMLKS